MPRGVISSLLHWLATHLVSITLIGFLIVGLVLSGVIQLPSRAAWKLGGVAIPHPGQRVGDPPASEDLRLSPSQPAARKAPKLIGGSLPVQGEAQFDGDSAASSGGGFRPSTAMPPGAAGRGREDLLQQARRAFWNGDFQAAEAAYIDLISTYPADADAFGELGNLYEAMGKPSEALDAHYEAGIRLRAAGETGKLQQVIDLLERKADPRARNLMR
jgi:hypothetical protein